MKCVIGHFRGMKVIPNKDPAKDAKVFIGVGTVKNNGYEGEEEIVDVKLTKDQIAQGVAANLMHLKDQLIKVDFWISSNAFNGKVYLDLMLERAPEAFHGFVKGVEAPKLSAAK